MRRFLSIAIAVAFIFGISFSQVYAGGIKTPDSKEPAATGNSAEKAPLGKNGLERAISIVKSKVDIPVNYTDFNSDIMNLEGKNLWRLRWSSNSSYFDKKWGSMEITVNDRGEITAYSHNKGYRGYDYKRRIPKISKAQALETARKFINFMCPEIADQVDFDTGPCFSTIEYDGSYRLYFNREANGIPFYDNGVSILAAWDNGEIINMNRDWTEDAVFPSAGEAMNLESAQKAFIQKVGLSLKYRKEYREDAKSTYLEYSPAVYDLNFSVDAVSGEKVAEGRKYNPYYESAYRNDIERIAPYPMMGDKGLSTDEIDEAVRSGLVISPETAAKKLTDIEELGITATAKVSGYGYNRLGNDGYTLQINFATPPSLENLPKDIPAEKLKVMIAAGEGGRMVNVVVNARTCELISFNSYGVYGGQKQTLTREEMKITAEGFLKKYKKSKYEQLEPVVNSGTANDYMMKFGGAPGPQNSFAYLRKVNGVTLEDNRININIDPQSGKISYYDENWSDLSFAPFKNVLDPDAAYAALFKYNGLSMRYTLTLNNPQVEKKPYDPAPQKPGIRLVYSPDIRKPVCIDAVKGILINRYNGQPFRDATTAGYNDTASSPSNLQITALAQIGLLPDADSFRPDDRIRQKDLLYMISRFRGSNVTTDSKGAMKQKEMDGMYRMLINDGVIDENEKEPDAEVTRENAVKYIINAAGYRKFAEMEGIFLVDYADKNAMDPKLFGYAAIAKSLGVYSGENGSFLPKQTLSRADAAVMIYNYLTK